MKVGFGRRLTHSHPFAQGRMGEEGLTAPPTTCACTFGVMITIYAHMGVHVQVPASHSPQSLLCSFVHGGDRVFI